MRPAEIVNAVRRALGLTRGSARTPSTVPPQRTPQPDHTGRGLLRGKTAVIVGAGVNIGLGIAREFAREEAELLVTNSSQGDLDHVVLALRADGCTARSMHSDVTAQGSVDALLVLLDESHITPDILVLNVGVHAAPGEPDPAEMERVFRTNVIAPLHVARRIARRMHATGDGGAIIFLSSIHEWSLFGEPLYSSSKAAIGMVVRELAAEFASARIRVNAIAPGWVAASPDGTPLPHRLTPLYKTSIPPAFIGKAAVHLAANSLSGHTSGTVLTVDGGASLLNSIVNPTYLSEAE